MSVEEKRAANFKFLDEAIIRGDKIVLSNSALEVKALPLSSKSHNICTEKIISPQLMV